MPRFLLTLCLLLVSAFAAQAEERIQDFSSDIIIQPDGTLDVTETIKVYAEQKQIRRGIYRDFPTRYTGSYGEKIAIRFTLHDVTQNGQSADYHTESRSNGIRVYIGNSNILLNPGNYTYRLHYQVDRELGFFQDYDELYWNVTGNGWIFPIEQAQANITLPDGATILQTAYFTGAFGAKDQNATETRINDRRVTFATTQRLNAGEGLTVAVAFTKGIIAEPSRGERLSEFIRDNKSLLLSLSGLLVLLLYYLGFWYGLGRDPQRGTIIPLFAAPQNLSPAALRYLMEMDCDQRCLVVTLLNLAAQNRLSISEDEDAYTLSLNDSSGWPMESLEDKTAYALFSTNNLLVLRKASLFNFQPRSERLDNYNRLTAGNKALSGALSVFNRKSYFNTNASVWWLGYAMATVLYIGSFMAGQTNPLSIAVGLVAFILPYPFKWLLKAPTKEGRKLMDEIEGFKRFLSVTEKERMKQLYPEGVTPEIFEKFLPYAVALEVEQAWSNHFAASLAEQGKDISNYQPDWYSGRGYRGFTPTTFASSINSTISSSMTAPGSSSGSRSGGGFSGGGGGGGGGGGW